MSTVIQYKHDQIPNKLVSLVECEAENPLPTSSVIAMDMVGLTWIFEESS
ncbi:MAG: hypothetical protein OEW86_10460 [Nitrosopumilus sp.]|nr:hypothetical protein [Nitrosopumilus sp.]